MKKITLAMLHRIVILLKSSGVNIHFFRILKPQLLLRTKEISDYLNNYIKKNFLANFDDLNCLHNISKNIFMFF